MGPLAETDDDDGLYRIVRAQSGDGVTELAYDSISRLTSDTTAGRTVVFSAVTVSAALITLVVFPQGFLKSMGIAGAGVEGRHVSPSPTSCHLSGRP